MAVLMTCRKGARHSGGWDRCGCGELESYSPKEQGPHRVVSYRCSTNATTVFLYTHLSPNRLFRLYHYGETSQLAVLLLTTLRYAGIGVAANIVLLRATDEV